MKWKSFMSYQIRGSSFSVMILIQEFVKKIDLYKWDG